MLHLAYCMKLELSYDLILVTVVNVTFCHILSKSIKALFIDLCHFLLPTFQVNYFHAVPGLIALLVRLTGMLFAYAYPPFRVFVLTQAR